MPLSDPRNRKSNEAFFFRGSKKAAFRPRCHLTIPGRFFHCIQCHLTIPGIFFHRFRGSLSGIETKKRSFAILGSALGRFRGSSNGIEIGGKRAFFRGLRSAVFGLRYS
jgi:hypothetical protein